MMNNKLPCEMIRDLFPSYIDGLTSDVTNGLIKEHVEECEKCKSVLGAMQEPSVQPVNPQDRQEIDFLKKTRKNIRRIICASVMLSVLVIATVLIVRLFFAGRHAYDEMLVWRISVDGKQISLNTMIGSEFGISSVDYEEQDGVVRVSCKYVQKSPFYQSSVQTEYTAKEEVRQVWIDDRIIWSQGENISALASAVYNTSHAYVGDMSANMQSANALGIADQLGSFTNELQTDTEPYGWKLIFQDEISPAYRQGRELSMKSYACILLAVIDNLGEVTCEYMSDGETCSLTVTEEDATAFAGRDIKECGVEVLELQKLLEQTKLDKYVYISDNGSEYPAEELRIEIANCTDVKISGYSMTYYLGGNPKGTMSCELPEGSFVKKGDVMFFPFSPYDFEGQEWTEEDEVRMEVTFYDEDGTEYCVPEPLYIAKKYKILYKFVLTGNPNDGFEISQ